MNADSVSVPETFLRERQARRWDRRITLLILLLLLLPFPFAQFVSWPNGKPLYVYLVMPWSEFRICYETLPGGQAAEQVYRFSWTGRIMPGNGSAPLLVTAASSGPLILKWQGAPEVVLRGLFQQGNFLEVKTFWQPLILWPLRMVWQTFEQR